MKFTIITLFPEMFRGPFDYSIVNRAIAAEKIALRFLQLRNFAHGKHHTVDDTPYGGGAGMILKVDVCVRALEAAGTGHRILLTPQGNPLTQRRVKELARKKHLILLCGHYEGFDARVRDFVDEELSIGPYILTGGEIPAMVVVDAVSRYIPAVLGHPNATKEESFTKGTLEYPQYTRPENFRGKAVPEVLLSGHHKKIADWRRKKSTASPRLPS